MKWHVMTSSANMPQSCWGEYRNIALVLVADGCQPPAIITRRARQVLQLEHLGHHHVGSTNRCAYEQVLARAQATAAQRNAALAATP